MEEEATTFLGLGKRGFPGHNSTKEVFMATRLDLKDERAQVDVRSHLDEIDLPPQIRRLYETIGNPASEYVFNHWRLLSLDFVRDRTRALSRESGQRDVVDFAACYAGMGYAVVCAYAPKLGKIFYRVDGGPNGYERDDNYQKLLAYRPTDPSTFFDVSHWFATVTSQISQEAYEPLNLPLTHLELTN